MPATQRNPLLRFTEPQGPPTLEGAVRLPLALIDANPAQARQHFDEAALQELADSIVACGVLQPIVVRPVGDRYQVVAGERRTRAARLAGEVMISAIIRELTDEHAAYIVAVENLQREDLTPADEARWLQNLLDLTGCSQRELARRLGKSHEYVSKRLRGVSTELTELPTDSAPQSEAAPPRATRQETDAAPPVPAQVRRFHDWLSSRRGLPVVAPDGIDATREMLDDLIAGLVAWRDSLPDAVPGPTGPEGVGR